MMKSYNDTIKLLNSMKLDDEVKEQLRKEIDEKFNVKRKGKFFCLTCDNKNFKIQ